MIQLMGSEIMAKRVYKTERGDIAYRVSLAERQDASWLVFLPGLTADHRLFDKQIDHFEGKANILVWDAPSHGGSRPFDLDWTLDDLARWLKQILDAEGIVEPILIGQSLGGYIAQAYMDLYPGMARGFVSIDSAPLQREYYATWELSLLKHMKLMYAAFPWKTLVKVGASGTTTSPYGRQVMQEMMLDYGKQAYCDLTAYGFKMVAEAVEKDRAYEIDCPTLIICGTRDNAGFIKKYNREWEKRDGRKVHWIEDAGHNSNCDAPDVVNALIDRFIESVSYEERGTDD